MPCKKHTDYYCHSCAGLPDEGEPMRIMPVEDYKAMEAQMVDLIHQRAACVSILEKMGYSTGADKLQNDLILFAFDAQFWLKEYQEMRAAEAAENRK